MMWKWIGPKREVGRGRGGRAENAPAARLPLAAHEVVGEKVDERLGEGVGAADSHPRIQALEALLPRLPGRDGGGREYKETSAHIPRAGLGRARPDGRPRTNEAT